MKKYCLLFLMIWLGQNGFSQEDSSLFNAIEADDIEWLDWVLEHGSDLNTLSEEKLTPLEYACSIGSLEVIKYLVSKRKVDINVNQGNNLIIALSSKKYEVAKYLIENGITLNTKENEFSPIHYAAKDNQVDIIHLLVSKGINVNSQTSKGWTPIMYAAYQGYLESCFWLYYYKANIDLKDIEEQTALDWSMLSNTNNACTFFLRSPKNYYHKAIGSTCGYRVEELFSEGRYTEAVPISEITLEQSLKIFGKSHIGYVINLNTLTDLYRLTDQYEKAYSAATKVLSILKLANNTDSEEYAYALNELGLIYLERGDYTKALNVLSEAISERYENSRG